MMHLTNSRLVSLSQPCAVSDHGVRPPGSLSAGAPSGVLVQSSRADRETCPGVCHDGVDEQTAPLLWTVRGESQVRWLDYLFFKLSVCGFCLLPVTGIPRSLPGSTVALCKLLQHSLNADDKRLQDIVVKGEEIYSPEDGIRTRSKSVKSKLPQCLQ